ncbi:MAG: hypothetical protein ACXWKP_30405 [Bradyrhizobium sp.]
MAGEKHREGFSGDVTSSEASVPAKDQPFGKNAVGKNQWVWKRSVCEVSAYSTV